MHGRGKHWPVTFSAGLDLLPPPCLASALGWADAALSDWTDPDEACFGLDFQPPPCLALPLGGADAALSDWTDSNNAGFGDDGGPTCPQRKMHGRGKTWPVTFSAGLDLLPPLCLASTLGGADAALSDWTDSDLACLGLDLLPPPCLASPLGGADAALSDWTDFGDAGFGNEWQTRQQRERHGRGEKLPCQILGRNRLAAATSQIYIIPPPHLWPSCWRPSMLCSVRVTVPHIRP